MNTPAITRSDVVIVGAGPAGSAAAAWAAQRGYEVLVIDSAQFPRDKTCGDGLTPRAVAELHRLGLGSWLDTHIQHYGLRLSGFGTELQLGWPSRSLPATGSAVPRLELDERIRMVAEQRGATMRLGTKVSDVSYDSRGRVNAVILADGSRIGCAALIVADGARSPVGRILGRQWHQETVYGVAVRGYLTSPRSHEPWIYSDLELRGSNGQLLPGYGWIFPLGNGEVNIGVGALATTARSAGIALRPLLQHYSALHRTAWGFTGAPRAVSSALLPMGGAVSGVAGANWMLIGDAAACVNPLNGEGIDYGLETGRLAAELLHCQGISGVSEMSQLWPEVLRAHYARSFSVARRLAQLLTVPRFLSLAGPVMMRSASLMTIAVRMMGNLITDDDADLVARLWRSAGAGSHFVDRRPPFS